jgi:hypothetical protein
VFHLRCDLPAFPASKSTTHVFSLSIATCSPFCCWARVWYVLQSDLALLTVPEEAFWTDLRPLEFIKETPELQVGTRAAVHL